MAGFDHGFHAQQVGVHLALGVGAKDGGDRVAEGACGRDVGELHTDARAAVAALREAHRAVVLVADELPKDPSWLNAREIERCFAKESERAP